MAGRRGSHATLLVRLTWMLIPNRVHGSDVEEYGWALLAEARFD